MNYVDFYKKILTLLLLITIAVSCNSKPMSQAEQNSNTMIEFIQNIADYLVGDAIEVDDLIPKVGVLENDHGFLFPMELKSNKRGIQSIQLSRYPDLNIPYLVTFDFNPEFKLTFSQLAKQFGSYKKLPPVRGMPIEYIFSEPKKGAHWEVYILFQIEQNTADEKTNRVINVTLRRDDLR